MNVLPTEGNDIEQERYELREAPRYRFDANRREFVQWLGAGLMIAVSARPASSQRPGGRQGRRAERLAERLHIGADGLVTVMTSKVEVGQGSRTQISQAAAEELDLPIERIRVIMADTELCPDDGGTAGSRTTPSTVPRVRFAAAAARQLLVELAARRLGAEPTAVQIREGDLVDASTGRRVSLQELAAEEALAEELDRTPPEGVSVTHVEQWKVLGQPAAKVGGRDVVTGAAQYPSDIQLPGMLYGSVLRPAGYNALLKSIDTSAADAMSGVTVVVDGNFIGCAAKTSWQASRAVETLAAAAQWEMPEQPSSATLFEHLKEHVGGSGSGWPRPRTDTWGDLQSGLAKSQFKLQTDYRIAYIQHAPMEPRAAVARWDEGQVTVWTGTQQPSRVQAELAQAFRIRPQQVRVIVPDTGGGFGGKHTGEVAVEAARLAQATGQPVSVRWTREDEFTWAYFRPAGLMEVEAGLDEGGNLLAWDFTNYNSGGSAIGTPYRMPHGRTRFLASQSPLRQGSYRALASTANVFARESAMDELAHAAELDPLEFRLRHLPEGRLRDVLLAAARRFDWQERRKGTADRTGVGLACGTEKGSYVAACVELQVDGQRIHIRSICQAYECGAIQNPANLRAQVEGCMVMGLGGALTEEIHFEEGRITNPRFSEYWVPRMADVPPMDIVLLDRRDLPSVGAGETPIIAVAPAIANALFHATGQRLRSMPLRL